jgi:hypothetical protein
LSILQLEQPTIGTQSLVLDALDQALGRDHAPGLRQQCAQIGFYPFSFLRLESAKMKNIHDEVPERSPQAKSGSKWVTA